MSRRHVYLVTGANCGLGLEATRQIAHLDPSCKIYLLCRSQARAQAAIKEIEGSTPSNRHLEFVRFDADAPTTISDICIAEDHIDGILLNAGGFGDSTNANEKKPSGASQTAQVNLIGHVVLVKHLMAQGKLGEGARIVAAGSEGCFATPGYHFDWERADLKGCLAGDVRSDGPGLPYTWIKGILALYWSAFARRHQNIYVVTVSPGSVTSTNFYKHKGATPVLTFFGKIASMCLGSNTVQDGAKHFTDALLGTQDFDGSAASGSFLAHRVGFAKDYGNATQVKRGVVFGDPIQQDRAWTAVESFL